MKGAQRTSQWLKQMRDYPDESISLQHLLEKLREGGFALLLMILAAPLALPLPAVGIATVMSLPILVLAVQLTLGFRSPRLPSRLGRKTISRKTMVKISDILIPYFNRLEKFLKPRVSFLSSSLGEKLVGLVCVICACSIAMPVPFSNTIPSLGIVLIAIGLLERDGLVIIGGMLVGLAGVALAVVIYYAGIEFVKGLF